MEEYLLVIEADVDYVKAIVKDTAGNERQRTEKKLESNISDAGWKEVDANEIWINTMYVILNLMKNCSVSPESIQKINVVGKKETIVLWGTNHLTLEITDQASPSFLNTLLGAMNHAQ